MGASRTSIVIHRYSHPAAGWKSKALCGQLVDRRSHQIRASDFMTTCAQCLRLLMMKRESELERLRERMEVVP